MLGLAKYTINTYIFRILFLELVCDYNSMCFAIVIMINIQFWFSLNHSCDGDAATWGKGRPYDHRQTIGVYSYMIITG